MRRSNKATLHLALATIVMGLSLLASTAAARADLVIHVDKSAQRMTIERDGEQTNVFPVSTGRSPYRTPSGTFRPQRLERKWFSRVYYNSPMPYSIFFYGGYAIHGTNAIRQLGGPASHGCIRLHPANAATLFAMVQRQGPARTRIVID